MPKLDTTMNPLTLFCSQSSLILTSTQEICGLLHVYGCICRSSGWLITTTMVVYSYWNYASLYTCKALILKMQQMITDNPDRARWGRSPPRRQSLLINAPNLDPLLWLGRVSSKSRLNSTNYFHTVLSCIFSYLLCFMECVRCLQSNECCDMYSKHDG